jgi:hypothetical protein
MVPVAGFVEFGWPANSVVLLGAFNVGVLFTSSASFGVALPRLLNADPRQVKLEMTWWTILTVCATWATVICVAFLTPALAPILNDSNGRNFVVLDAGFFLAGASLSLAAARTFFDRLREYLEELSEEVTPPDTKIPSIAASVFLYLLPIFLEGWVIWLLVLPLALVGKGDDLGPALAVTVVTAVSLFLDALLTIWPAKKRRVPK